MGGSAHHSVTIHELQVRFLDPDIETNRLETGRHVGRLVLPHEPVVYVDSNHLVKKQG